MAIPKLQARTVERYSARTLQDYSGLNPREEFETDRLKEAEAAFQEMGIDDGLRSTQEVLEKVEW